METKRHYYLSIARYMLASAAVMRGLGDHYAAVERLEAASHARRLASEVSAHG